VTRRGILVLVLVALATLLVARGAVLAVQGPTQSEGRIDSISQIVAGLSNQPQQWLGRIVRVRAVVGGFVCPGRCAVHTSQPFAGLQSSEWYPFLTDPLADKATPSSQLLMLVEPRNHLLDRLSQLPLVGGIIPPGQRVAWYSTAVYRLRLQAGPCLVGKQPCFEGVLVDAIPGDPLAG
jgi:hypothetical protein